MGDGRSREAGCEQQLLLDQVDARHEAVDIGDDAAAEPRVHLEQPRAATRVLRLGMQHPVAEAERERGSDAEIGHRCKPLRRVRRGRMHAGLHEVRLLGGPVLGDRREDALAAREHDVDVELGAVEVLLEQRSQPCWKIAFSSGRDQRGDAGIAGLEHLGVVGAQAAEGLRSEDRLDHGREPDLCGGGREALGSLEPHEARRGQAGGPARLERSQLAARRIGGRPAGIPAARAPRRPAPSPAPRPPRT